MKRLLLLNPRTSDAAASCPGDRPTVDTQLSMNAARERSALFKSREDFQQTLEVAEEEARNINAKWKLPNEDLEIPESRSRVLLDGKHPTPKQVNCSPENDRVQYSYDIQSANEEVLSNVKEVQRFNEELELAKEEAQAINDKWGQINGEPTVDMFDSSHALDLVISILEVVREPLVILDNNLCVKKANRAFHRIFRQSEKDTETVSIYELAQGAWNIPSLKSLLEKVVLDSRAYEEIEVETEFPQVGRKTLRLNVRRLSGGEMILMAIRDVTPRRRTEVELSRVQDELRQGQKMEVIGRLAGGVAHDFNNILTGILGFSEILMNDLGVGTEAYHQAAEIKKASERAAALTQQLLAFSRRQVLRPQVVNLNTVILGLSEMLRRLIGDNIRLNNTLDEKLGALCADPGQIGQVILNLALNARDAMTKGGMLSIRTENVQVDEMGERIRGLAPGRYVSLTVTDSGTGMDLETQQHIFEPFYTTKPQGSGTGLGLATVFGVVNQSGGHIQFTSELNCGTTFWIDFPRVEGSSSVPAPRERAEMLTGTETIMVVEDDELVRELVLILLQRQGYTVLDVGQADQALAMCESYSSRIDLILTDLLMPGKMDGRDLVEQVLKIRPEIKVLLMSGYTTDAMAVSGVKEGVPFLQKPFTQQELAGKVREVLNNTV
ncbi:ATP-binding protein [Tunturiibacter lichenicola]|uniref:ATP-binding protein n=1 Tax=Tunturiibacter lichenicola TaxID=2051959 RepID=UPI003D9B9BAA